MCLSKMRRAYVYVHDVDAAGTTCSRALDPSPLWYTLHRRAESHLVLLCRSPPRCIRPQVPIGAVTIQRWIVKEKDGNRRTDICATSTRTAHPCRYTRCVTKVATGYVVATLSGPRP